MNIIFSVTMYMTQYTEFIKSWAQRNNKSYMCAATDPRAREEYYGSYPKRPTKSKLKQNREKQTAAVMGLMEMGAKAKESAAAKDAAAAAIPERNSDLARYNESKTNPAVGVLTNPDLVRMIGSFSRGMKKPIEASDFFNKYTRGLSQYWLDREGGGTEGDKYTGMVLNSDVFLPWLRAKGVMKASDYSENPFKKLIEFIADQYFIVSPATPYNNKDGKGAINKLSRDAADKYTAELKAVELLLSGKIPDNFDYEGYRRIHPGDTYDNAKLKRLFSNWNVKKAGKKESARAYRDRTFVSDPNA